MKKILSIILACAMLLTMLPVSFAADYAYEVTAGAESFEAKAGEEISVPIYLVPKSGAETVQMVQINLPLVEGLELASWTKGALTASDAVSVDSSINTVVIFQDNEFTASADVALVTLVYKATAAGTYTIKSEATELYNADYDPLEGEYGEVSIELSFKDEITPEPPVVSDDDYVIKTAEESYTAKVGEEITVPVYVVPKAGATAIQMVQINLPLVEGLELASWTNGALTASDAVSVDSSINTVVIFQDNEFTASADVALVTLVYKATAAGTYTIKSEATELYNADYDPLEGTYAEVEFVITAEGDVPPAPEVQSIAVTPETLTVPVANQADVKAYVESKIEKVVATYSDNSTEEVAGYTVDVAGTTATVTYEGKTDTIALTMEVPAPTLVSIAVTPETLTVPVENQADVKAYVESKIEQVVATYSDDSTKVVTDYTVEVAGTTATVKYEGTTATIALTLEEEPPVVSDDDYVIKTAEESYTAKVGEEITVPVYVVPKAGATAIQMVQINLPLVEGLELASWTNGALTASDAVSVDSSINTVVIFQDNEFTASADVALVTLVYKATAAGTYTIKSEATELYNADYDPLEGTYAEVEFVITAEGEGPDPVEPTLEAITVNVTATPVVVPVGADPVETVRAAITGVTAAYSDGSVVSVTDYTVTVDGDVATVSYMDKKFEIAVEIEVAPTDVEIIPVQTEITVPYGTEDVQAYLDSKLGTVTIKNSDGESRTETATVTYNAETGIATVAYGELSADVTVTVVELTGYTVTTADGADTIVIPYDETDAAAYVASKVAVVGNLSDGSTLDNVVFTVEITENVATIKVGDEAVGEVAVEYAEPPVAAIVDIEIVVADAIVVPYGATDIAAYVESVITVNTIDENGEKAPTSDYTITAEDGVATVVYGEFTKTVDYTLETAVIVPSVSVIEIPYTVAAEDYAAYIAENVTFAVDYTANTTDETVTVTAEQVEIGEGIAVVTVKEGSEPVEIQFTVEAAPEYIATVIDGVYNLEGKSLVKITGVADGKIAVVDGINATYFGNGTFAVVVDTDKVADIEVVEAEMPAVAEFGKLHDAAVSAYDALMTNDAALEKADIPAFVDIQNYIIADIDGNGELDATDAYAVNQISLLGAAAVNTWVSAQ